MYWKFDRLDPLLQEKLIRVGAQRGLDAAPIFFQRGRQFPALLYPILGLGVGWGVYALPFQGRWDDWIAKSVGFFVAAMIVGTGVLETVRSSASRLRPFLLLTPKVLIRADYQHGYLEAYRLRDATDFRRIEQYRQRVYLGQEYAFVFPERRTEILVKAPEDISRIEAVVERAGTEGSVPPDAYGLDLVPAEGGVRGYYFREIERPHVWLAILGLLLAAVLVTMLILEMLGFKV